ncbi:unnamed protein product [Pylaiella littoralis]
MRAAHDNNMWQKKSMVSKEGNGPERTALLYFFGLLGCIVAGFAAPGVFISKYGSYSEGVATADSDYLFAISDYKPSHQSIYLALRLQLPVQLENAMELNNLMSYAGEGRYSVSVYGSDQPRVRTSSDDCPAGCVSCPDGEEGLTCDLLAKDHTGVEAVVCQRGDDWCSWLSLYSVAFVEHQTYYWAVEVEYDIDEFIANAETGTSERWISEFLVVFGSSWYTSFELAWFYSWIFITLLVMFLPRRGFFTVAFSDRVPWSKWKVAQRWLAFLLAGLLFFNNPFVAAQVYSGAKQSTFSWYAAAQGIFVSMLLLFWLDRIRLAGGGDNNKGSKWKRFAVGMAGLVLALLICGTYILLLLRHSHGKINERGHASEMRKYEYTSASIEMALAVACFVYCFGIVVLSALAWWDGSAAKFVRRGRRAQFFVLSSFITMALLFPSVILGYLLPRVRGGAAFTTAHGGVNLYVLALALLCTPKHGRGLASDNNNNNGIGEDEEDIATADKTVNPMVHQQAIDAADAMESKQGPGLDEEASGSSFWRGRRPGKSSRPKIQDSSLWED